MSDPKTVQQRGCLEVECLTDYILPDGPENSIWIKVRNLAVNIIRSEKGITVEVHREDISDDAVADPADGIYVPFEAPEN